MRRLRVDNPKKLKTKRFLVYVVHLNTGKYKNKNFSQETEFLEVLEQIVVGIGYGERVTV